LKKRAGWLKCTRSGRVFDFWVRRRVLLKPTDYEEGFINPDAPGRDGHRMRKRQHPQLG
jgi:hypothetical protein